MLVLVRLNVPLLHLMHTRFILPKLRTITCLGIAGEFWLAVRVSLKCSEWLQGVAEMLLVVARGTAQVF